MLAEMTTDDPTITEPVSVREVLAGLLVFDGSIRRIAAAHPGDREIAALRWLVGDLLAKSRRRGIEGSWHA